MQSGLQDNGDYVPHGQQPQKSLSPHHYSCLEPRKLTAHRQRRRASFAGPAQGKSNCAGPTLKPRRRAAKSCWELAHCGLRLNANTTLYPVCLSQRQYYYYHHSSNEHTEALGGHGANLRSQCCD
ncbi:rCG48032 [Rattus norvegicus]|uniref:RCG48032 n=1 Tax=Rattus norvegicus TaxID=10116 RepID=A6HX89_RAT|nr:rCG48032 [Rattus norvegicus]